MPEVTLLQAEQISVKEGQWIEAAEVSTPTAVPSPNATVVCLPCLQLFPPQGTIHPWRDCPVGQVQLKKVEKWDERNNNKKNTCGQT